MDEGVVEKKALGRIKNIHQLSLKFNEMVGKSHQERLLELMRKHVDELEELANKKDPHYLIETGDLLILCFELLLDGRMEIDEVTQECFGRYERKLSSLIKEHG